MDMEVALKVGFLSVPPQNFLRKTWLKRYCALYDASNHGIQRMELFESEDACAKQNPTKIIPLTDCWKVTPLPQKHQPNVFEIRTKSNSYQFSADLFQDMSDWLVSLQAVAFSKNQPKFVPSTPTTEEKQEENLLYCSMDEPEVYSVKAVSTDAALRNNLKGDYKLVITSVNFSIAEESSHGRIGKIILTWPFRHIRRYGCGTENFSFEAGRKCSSGEGLFTFTTSDGLKIFQSVDGHVSALKSTQGEAEVPNSPIVKEDKSNCFTSKDSLKSTDLISFSNTFKPGQFPIVDSDVLLNQKSNLKSLPPIRKPPRKSKSHAYDLSSDSVNLNAISTDSPNQYAEICRRNSSDILNRNSDIVPSHSIQANIYSVSDISHLPDRDDLSSYTETLKISEIPRKDVKVKRASASLDYENCGPGFENTLQSSRPTFTNEHIYGKLISARQSVPPTTGNVYGSIVTNTIAGSSPVYTNFPYSKQSVSENSNETKPEPEHFMKNDAEYAQVLKKNKNSL